MTKASKLYTVSIAQEDWEAKEARTEELEAACSAMREALEELAEDMVTADHHRDDCPEENGCAECRRADRVNAALATAAGKAMAEQIEMWKEELRRANLRVDAFSAELDEARVQWKSTEELAEKAERERDESAQETAEMVRFLQTQLGWEWFWSEGFVGQEHKSQATQNAQAIRKFLDDTGHAKRFCERLKEREAERDEARERCGDWDKAAAILRASAFEQAAQVARGAPDAMGSVEPGRSIAVVVAGFIGRAIEALAEAKP
jgi:hypothetical protein